jgi:hypothetical protein
MRDLIASCGSSRWTKHKPGSKRLHDLQHPLDRLPPEDPHGKIRSRKYGNTL